MSNILGISTLNGYITEMPSLRGQLSYIQPLVGSLSSHIDFATYAGDYEVIPKAYQEQTLYTQDKVLKENIIVHKVQYFETTNAQNGLTVYIAEG